MAERRDREPFTALRVKAEKRLGRWSDAGCAGLYLQVSAAGTKSWLMRYQINGRAREMGLGSVGVVSLADARRKVGEARKLLDARRDPIEVRRQADAEAAARDAKAMTFDTAAAAFIAAHRAGWRNSKHADQWENTLETYASPIIGALPVQAIDTHLVLKVLEPIWTKKTETAVRVRGRVEKILDWARARGSFVGENPARWRGHLDKLLPPPRRVAKAGHHPALPYVELPVFMIDLKKQQGVGALALHFAVLTAARTNEVLGMKHDEIDVAAKTWNVPASRMKGGRPHRVPLSDAALAIIKAAPKIEGNDYVFAGAKKGKPASSMLLLMTLRRMKRPDITAHGFRSTFRDWAAERTAFAREVAEAALAHSIRDATEAAYRRGDLFAKRRQLMQAWADYCNSAGSRSAAKVTAIRDQAA